LRLFEICGDSLQKEDKEERKEDDPKGFSRSVKRSPELKTKKGGLNILIPPTT
jgi:hypothetical protein